MLLPSSKLFFLFLFLCTLSLLGISCDNPPPSNPTALTLSKDSLPPNSMPLQQHQVAVLGHLDGKEYLQLIDTTTSMEERIQSPVYECSCSQAGSCKIELGSPGYVSCVPTANGCKPNPIVIEQDHSCGFKKVKDTHFTPQLESVLIRNYAYAIGDKVDKAQDYTTEGFRFPNFYSLELEDSNQLIALYTLNNGQQIVELQPRNAAEPIQLTCACSCAGGSDCDMRIISGNQIACRPQSACLPVANGNPCDGCRLERVTLSSQELKKQLREEQIFKK